MPAEHDLRRAQPVASRRAGQRHPHDSIVVGGGDIRVEPAGRSGSEAGRESGGEPGAADAADAAVADRNASPSRPPSPPGRASGTAPTREGVPSGSNSRTVAVSRWLIRVPPSGAGRRRIDHGASRPEAIATGSPTGRTGNATGAGVHRRRGGGTLGRRATPLDGRRALTAESAAAQEHSDTHADRCRDTERSLGHCHFLPRSEVRGDCCASSMPQLRRRGQAGTRQARRSDARARKSTNQRDALSAAMNFSITATASNEFSSSWADAPARSRRNRAAVKSAAAAS